MLLDTALALIARQGEAALTLGAVADEAGLARATIYGYFSGKKDLLAALDGANIENVAAQLTGLPLGEATAEAAQTVAGAAEHGIETAASPAQVVIPAVEKASEQETQTQFAFSPEAAVVQDREQATTTEPAGNAVSQQSVDVAEQPAAEDAPEVSAPEVVPGAVDIAEAVNGAQETPVEPAVSEPPEITAIAEQQDAPAADSDTDETAPLTPHEQERRLQAEHLEEIAKRLILPESAIKEGTDAVISRLETRLRVLERSIAGLETRQSAVPDETAKKVKPVSDLVVQLQTRADAMEDRQRQALAELRLSIHELTARQSTLGATPAAVPEMAAWPEGGFNPVKAEDVPVEPATAEKSEEPAAGENGRSAYLSTARNLAKEGARQAAERESLLEEDQRRRRRHLLTAAGIAGLCLIAVGTLFVLRPGPHGVSTAQSKSIPRSAIAKTSHAVASAAPLDRLTALANRGDARAELVVGLKYLQGDGVTVSDKDAAHWFERAAEAGNAVAQNHLGALYQAGRGVPADMGKAMHWYEAAAQQGDRHAMSNLAVLYAGGSGGPKNFAEAARWFQRSAELGYIDAQFNLAVLFERGDGVPQSLLDAYKWYSIAAAAGDPVAKTRADAIATQVSSEELQAAQLVAANFKPRPMNRGANDVPTMADVLASR